VPEHEDAEWQNDLAESQGPIKSDARGTEHVVELARQKVSSDELTTTAETEKF